MRQNVLQVFEVFVQRGQGSVGVAVGAAVGVVAAVGFGRLVGGDVAAGVTGGRLAAVVGVAVCPDDPDALGAGVMELGWPLMITCAGGTVPNPPWGNAGPSPPRTPVTATTPIAPMVATPVPSQLPSPDQRPPNVGI